MNKNIKLIKQIEREIRESDKRVEQITKNFNKNLRDLSQLLGFKK